jgi:hypothetical protein
MKTCLKTHKGNKSGIKTSEKKERDRDRKGQTETDFFELLELKSQTNMHWPGCRAEELWDLDQTGFNPDPVFFLLNPMVAFSMWPRKDDPTKLIPHELGRVPDQIQPDFFYWTLKESRTRTTV